MRLLTAIAALLSVSASAPATIAVMLGGNPAERQIALVDEAAGTVRPIGPRCAAGPPRWSSGGRFVAVALREDLGGQGIAVLDPAEGACRRLKHAHPHNSRPAWAPDGRRIAYQATPGDAPLPILCVYDLETGREEVWAGGAAGLFAPAWLDAESNLLPMVQDALSGSGTPEAALWESIRPAAGASLLCIQKTREADGKWSTRIVLALPDALLPLPPSVMPSPGAYAEWNVVPDTAGTSLAFESNDGGDREIYARNYKGSINLSNHRAADWNPVWGPGGLWLAFESFRGGRRGVYRVRTSTALVRPVYADKTMDAWGPTWSPDGSKIALAAGQGGNSRLAVVTLKTGNVRFIETTGPVFAPAWRPEATQ